MRRCIVVAAVLLTAALVAEPSWGFVTFESGQVRPLALSPDGTRLFATNTPDDRLEIFDVSGGTLEHLGSVPVGMEPVAVAARTDAEVWVVNHLSDSVSIVDVAAVPPRVVQTLLVGDEPRDIVFAGATRNRALVTCAHRGQNSTVLPQLTTPGIGRADVFVFNAPARFLSSVRVLFTDTPRALAVSADGTRAYAAGFHTGNGTTTISEGAVCDGGELVPPCTFPGGLPGPNSAPAWGTQPEVGLIVRKDYVTGAWEDELGRDWDVAVQFELPDLDVFELDTSGIGTATTLAQSFAHVGTVIFNLAVNPVSGKVYVSNTEARNERRFEGTGILAGSTVRGHLHEARITVLDGASVEPHHLNPHIDYDVFPTPPGVSDLSLAIPTGMEVTSDGATLYVAALGSDVVARIDTAALEGGTFAPALADHAAVTGGGPTGLALDETNGLLYVLTRFDNGISAIDLVSHAEVEHVTLHNPEPAHVVAGRPFLYDARFTSGNGEAACASCHVFGDFDSLAWDLGDPDGITFSIPNPIRVDNPFAPTGTMLFRPLKGPMTTQSLRGLANHGPMHWRGDRAGANVDGDVDEIGSFMAFNVAFKGLLGRETELTPTEMRAFTDFILEVVYPPNPIRALDNSLTPAQEAGRDFFLEPIARDVFQSCDGCHKLDPARGFFGTDGFSSFENETQMFKIPHLRNLYQKVGMFGMPWVPFLNMVDNGFKGDQVRGFGYLHDGSIDTVFRFLHAVVFNPLDFPPFTNPGAFPFGPEGDAQRRQVEEFMFAFDAELAPIVGQQTTRTSTNAASSDPRIDLLVARANKGECDLIVKGSSGGIARGWFRMANGKFRSDRLLTSPLSETQLRSLVSGPGTELTFTCVPPGEGFRAGVDRDLDGYLDRDELDAGSDPADPASFPAAGSLPAIGKVLLVKNKLPDDPARNKIVLQSKDSRIAPALPGTSGDPRCGSDPPGTVKAMLVITSTAGEAHTAPLPCHQWKLLGSEIAPRGYRYREPEDDEGTVRSGKWTPGGLSFKLLGGVIPLDFDLVPGVPQGTVRATFTAGTRTVCLSCVASAGRDGSDGKTFLARSDGCLAPPTCPLP
jgi:DNA-binding beta-propeller fold protein YncE